MYEDGDYEEMTEGEVRSSYLDTSVIPENIKKKCLNLVKNSLPESTIEDENTNNDLVSPRKRSFYSPMTTPSTLSSSNTERRSSRLSKKLNITRDSDTIEECNEHPITMNDFERVDNGTVDSTTRNIHVIADSSSCQTSGNSKDMSREAYVQSEGDDNEPLMIDLTQS